MSLKESLANPRKQKPAFDMWLEALPPAELDALEDAGRDPRYTNTEILDAIHAEGQPISKDTITKWRRTLVARG